MIRLTIGLVYVIQQTVIKFDPRQENASVEEDLN